MQESRAQRSFLHFWRCYRLRCFDNSPSNATLSQFRKALKIAAKLSMLGLPRERIPR